MLHIEENDKNDDWLLMTNGEDEREQSNIFIVLKEKKNCQPRILYPAKMFLINEGKIKDILT